VEQSGDFLLGIIIGALVIHIALALHANLVS